MSSRIRRDDIGFSLVKPYVNSFHEEVKGWH